ncbi:MAG TPA: hypothetical protein VN914_18570, partial [Polyangia bacterium]|nr:hypothetical protein [Polyangia bacterium]
VRQRYPLSAIELAKVRWKQERWLEALALLDDARNWLDGAADADDPWYVQGTRQWIPLMNAGERRCYVDIDYAATRVMLARSDDALRDLEEARRTGACRGDSRRAVLAADGDLARTLAPRHADRRPDLGRLIAAFGSGSD